jgi:uncharacterized membrane protein (DUF106 family)
VSPITMIASLVSVSWCSVALSLFLINSPLILVILISLVIGLLMVVVFRYTSDQRAIRRAKDQLKAHMLAVRLFQDQLVVVMRAYGHILLGTGRYIRLAFKPMLFVILPLVFLIVQLDRYLGWMPLRPAEAFLLKVRTTGPDALNEVSVQLPPEMTISAPAVHVPADNEVVWRVIADKNGAYDINVATAGQTFSKQVAVSLDIVRISPIRLRDHFWTRMFTSGEPALPESSPIESIEVTYPARNIDVAGFESNWIILFFILSIVAGFIFKSVLGIEI